MVDDPEARPAGGTPSHIGDSRNRYMGRAQTAAAGGDFARSPRCRVVREGDESEADGHGAAGWCREQARARSPPRRREAAYLLSLGSGGGNGSAWWGSSSGRDDARMMRSTYACTTPGAAAAGRSRSTAQVGDLRRRRGRRSLYDRPDAYLLRAGGGGRPPRHRRRTVDVGADRGAAVDASNRPGVLRDGSRPTWSLNDAPTR